MFDKRKISGAVGLFCLIAVICVLYGGVRTYRQPGRESKGVPDVVSSRTSGDETMLTVVANTDRIEDEQAFAEETVRKYEENSFYTTKFSRDQERSIQQVHMTVYLRRSDIGENPALFSIEYDVINREFKIIE